MAASSWACPARFVRTLDAEAQARLLKSAEHYRDRMRRFRAGWWRCRAASGRRHRQPAVAGDEISPSGPAAPPPRAGRRTAPRPGGAAAPPPPSRSAAPTKAPRRAPPAAPPPPAAIGRRPRRQGAPRRPSAARFRRRAASGSPVAPGVRGRSAATAQSSTSAPGLPGRLRRRLRLPRAQHLLRARRAEGHAQEPHPRLRVHAPRRGSSAISGPRTEPVISISSTPLPIAPSGFTRSLAQARGDQLRQRLRPERRLVIHAARPLMPNDLSAILEPGIGRAAAPASRAGAWGRCNPTSAASDGQFRERGQAGDRRRPCRARDRVSRLIHRIPRLSWAPAR